MYMKNLEQMRKQLNLVEQEPQADPLRKGLVPTRMLNQPEAAPNATNDPINITKEWLSRIKTTGATFREKSQRQIAEATRQADVPIAAKVAAKIVERRKPEVAESEQAERPSMFGQGGIDFEGGGEGGGNFSLDISDAGSLVRQKEGFRTTAYWDVNHWRTGYGSDTVTRADGTIEKVTKNTVVTKADAERDLARRIAEFQRSIISKVGEDSWTPLPTKAKAALTSVTYNYGRLPTTVAKAVQTGDLGRIANAVEALSSHNEGINAKRRRHEAALIRSSLG